MQKTVRLTQETHDLLVLTKMTYRLASLEAAILHIRDERDSLKESAKIMNASHIPSRPGY